ncbi:MULTISPECIES: hypothetical protein [Shouchella]|uniref:Uncharacterized protein n=2 Tax=Shouchella TaxID=2893057 RepID=A0ABY7W9M7_9BACI|nr:MULTISPECIES: hypothetical protein [Shouchella]MED4130466.1 hypothetical protein [Shouchella miscanthi]WDF05154.1 hypothetical protein PQ477_06705 [Shouchella hunanensis]GAF23060.1 hypothetical protein JCM19047_2849 [Bacillus sp. JCM 19047]
MYKLICTINGITKTLKDVNRDEVVIFNDLFEAELYAEQLNKDRSYSCHWVPEPLSP